MASRQFHIAIDSTPLRYSNTGLGKFCSQLLKELAEQDIHDLNIDAILHPNSFANISHNNISRSDTNWLTRHVPLLQPLLFKKHDLWHITAENTRLKNVRKSTKVLLTIHGMHFLDEVSKPSAQIKLIELQKLIDRADEITTVSDYTSALVKDTLNIGNRPIHKIYNGIEVSTEIKRPKHIPAGKFLFSIGTFFERKNFKVLLPFISGLQDYSLVLAGNDNTTYGRLLNEEVSKSGLTHKVLIPGEISGAEKNWYYEKCEAFLFPSLSEGFGIPVIEAFHYGKPVFASCYGSLPEIGKAHAFYWENFDRETMLQVFFQKMEEFKNDPLKSVELNSYAKDFTWKKAAIEYLKLYRHLLN